MPIIRDISLSLKTREVLRREGFGGHAKIRPVIKSLILELLASVKKAVPRKSTSMVMGIGPRRPHRA